MHNTKPRMRGGEFVEDAAGSIVRAVINGDDFQTWIIDIHQRDECGWQFFFFVTRGEEN